MSTTATDLELRIKAATEGLSSVQALADQIDVLGGDSKALREEASKLNADLALLGRQQAVIDNFNATEAAAAKAASTLADLRAKAEASASAQDSLSTNLGMLRSALDQTRTRSEDLRSQMQHSGVVVEELTARFGRNSQFVSQAKDAYNETKRALKDSTDAEKELERAITADEAALNKQSAALSRLNPQIEAAESAVREQAEALTQAGKAADYAGINTSDLAAEQQRVTRETINAKGAANRLTADMQDEVHALGGAELAAQKLAAASKNLGNEQEAAADKNEQFEASIRRAGAALLGFAGIQLGRQIVTDLANTADEIHNVESRLQLATKSQQEFNAAQFELTRIAQATRSAYGGTVDLYSSLARSTEQLNIPQQQLLDLTETISQAMKVGGGSAESQNAALVQLSQGFASGVLRGDEFNSVMEQSPRLAKAMADGLGVPIGQLRAMAENGELTSERIVKALQSQRAAIDTEFAQIPATIGGAVTQLDNAVSFYIRDFDKANGISEKTVELIQGVASHLDEIAKLAAVAGEVMVANLAIKGAKAALDYAAAMAEAAKQAGSVGAAVGKIPTSLKVAIAVVGFELLQEAGKLLGEYTAQLAGADDAIKAYGENRKRQLGEELVALEGVARTLNEYRGLQILSADELMALGKTGQQAYAQQLDGLEKLLLANNSIYLREQELAKLRGQSTDEWDKKLAGNAAQLRAVRDEQNAVEAALMSTAKSLKDGITPAAQALVDKFDELIKKGKSAVEAINGLMAALDIEHSQSVENVIGALGKLADQGKIAAADLDRTLGGAIEKLSDEDLVKLRVTAEAAFGGSAQQAGVLASTLDAIRNEQIKRLGVDSSQVLDGIDAKARQLIDTFAALTGDPRTDPKVLAAAWTQLLQTLDSPQELESLKSSLQGVQIKGFDAAAALGAIEDKIKALPAAEQPAIDGITIATEGIKTLSAAMDVRIQKEKDAAAAAQTSAETTVGANEQVVTSYHDLLQGISGVTVDNQDSLNGFRTAANAAFASGKLSADEYRAAIELINSKQQELTESTKTYTNLWAATRAAASEFLGTISKTAQAAYEASQQMSSGTQLATGSIEEMQESIRTLDSWIVGNMRVNDEWWGSLAKVANEGFAVERSTLSQKIALEQWKETLDKAMSSADGASVDLGAIASQAERAMRNMNLLDDSDLSQLRAQIASARQQIQGLRDDADATLTSLKEELAQAQGDLVTAQQLRNEQRMADLQSQLAAAQATGDREAIATLQQAIATLRQINTIDLASAREQQQQAQQTTSTTTQPQATTTTTTPAKKVTVELVLNGKTVSGDFTESDADALLRMLQQAGLSST